MLDFFQNTKTSTHRKKQKLLVKITYQKVLKSFLGKTTQLMERLK